MKVINSVLFLCLLVFSVNISGFLKLEDVVDVPKTTDEIERYDGFYQFSYIPFVYQDMDEVEIECKPSLLLKFLKSKPMIPLMTSLVIGNAFKNSFACFVSKLGLKTSVVATIFGKLGFESAKKFFDCKFQCPGD